MTEAERTQYEGGDELSRLQLLKRVARRLEGKVLESLQARGVVMEIRFHPKLKQEGLLDVK